LIYPGNQLFNFIHYAFTRYDRLARDFI